MELATDPKYISGIYNYCDRWCERCPFTSRCLNYVSTDDRSVSTEARDVSNQDFQDKLGETFETTIEMLKDMANECGVDLDNLDHEELDRERALQKAQAESHILAEVSKKYASDVNKWFEIEDQILLQRGEQLIREFELQLPDGNPEEEAMSIKDCVEVIRWYQYQLHVKLMRALMHSDIEEILDDEYPSDADGSAKVALIGMDRSIAAWSRLLEHFPSKTDDILNHLLTLDRMRKKTELEYPNARGFVRPGFDTESSPVAQ
jgi:hypothetical protein